MKITYNMHAENIQRLFGTTEFTSPEDPQVLHHKNCFPETNLPPQNGPPPAKQNRLLKKMEKVH